MYIINENEREYRFGDSGPKYLMKGPRMNFAIVQFMPGQDFTAHYHNVMEENFFILYTIEVKGRERRNMEEKHTCVLNHDEYELLNFYRQLSEERKQKFFDLVQTLDMLLNQQEDTTAVAE